MITASQKDVRELGYSKIWRSILRIGGLDISFSEDANKILSNRPQFMVQLTALSAMFGATSISSYSMMDYMPSVMKLTKREAGYLQDIMLNLCPFAQFSGEKPSVQDKRKFRDLWESLWASFANSTGLSKTDVALLSSVGLKLPLYLAAVELTDGQSCEFFGGTPDQICDCVSNDDDADVCRPEGLFNYLQLVRFACMFYNAVFGWYLTVKSDADYAELLSKLTVLDSQEFLLMFADGGREVEAPLFLQEG